MKWEEYEMKISWDIWNLRCTLLEHFNSVIFPSSLLPESPASDTYKLSRTLKLYAAMHFITSDTFFQ